MSVSRIVSEIFSIKE